MDSPGGHRGAGSRPAGSAAVITATGAAEARAADAGGLAAWRLARQAVPQRPDTARAGTGAGPGIPEIGTGGPGTGPPGQRPAWTAPAGRPGGPGSAGVAGSAAAAASHTDASGDGSGMTGDATEPLAVVGDPGRALPGQIARFGELAGRDLMARAFAALRERGACDPRRHGDARTGRPLTSGEQLEMVTLRAAITADHRPAAIARPADTGRSAPAGPQLPARLRRPPPPAPRRADGRHRRVADTGPS